MDLVIVSSNAANCSDKMMEEKWYNIDTQLNLGNVFTLLRRRDVAVVELLPVLLEEGRCALL